MKRKLISIIFFFLIVFFGLSLLVIFSDYARDWAGDMFLPIFVLFSILGVFLVFLVFKENIGRKKKKFLLLTGYSASLVFVSILLHNAFYALGLFFEDSSLLGFLMQKMSVFFFFLSIIILPFLFLMGALGVICLSLKKK